MTGTSESGRKAAENRGHENSNKTDQKGGQHSQKSKGEGGSHMGRSEEQKRSG